ncbi:uncharacterized protein LOC133800499 isoform X2 [Humulus lupulus]|uniref:uncharacterized protein LOC133800499 isoform X2 n=1 Tax=Humulus lupulus TaxID=3486 RepID=UPI002B409D4E|nr:uncharacterized protein LOC133800499 isoform X2 [Humulus lupulus]
MSTIEKLCVQIFERKSWIIDQVRQQTLLFDKHLASKLLIDGIAPPPWFWTSDSTGVLLSRPRPVIPFAFSHCSVYEKPIVEATNEELPNGSCTKLSVENRELDGLDCARRASVCMENRECDGCDHAQCAPVGVSTLDHCNTFVEDQINEAEDACITSPQDQRDTRFSDISHEAALSLAKIQRSKFRQKALELRTTSKAAKSRLKNANNFGGSIPIPFLQDGQPEQLNFSKSVVENRNNICTVEGVKLGEPCSKYEESTMNSTKSSGWQQSSLNAGSSSNVVREDGIALSNSIGPLIQQSNMENQPRKFVKKFQIPYGNHIETEIKVGENMSKEKGSGSSNVVREDGAALRDSIGPSTQQSNWPLESVNHFQSRYSNCIASETNVEASSFNGVSAHSAENNTEGRLLERSPPVLSESAGVLDKGMSENYQENLNLPLEEGEVLSEEICAEDADTAVNETPHVEKGVATNKLQHSYRSSKEKSSLRDGSGLKEVTSSKISNVNVDMGMNLSFETETTTPVIAISAEIVSVDRLKTISSVDHKLSIDVYIPQITKPDLFEIQEACTDLGCELPCSVSKDETTDYLAQSKANSKNSQFCTGLCQSTERQTAAKSTEKTSFGALLEGSTRNKRKRSGSLDTLPASPGAKENVVLLVNKDSETRNLLSEDHGQKYVPESQDLQSPQYSIQLDISKCQVEEIIQNEEDDMKKGSKSSPKLLDQEDNCSLKDRDLSATTQITSADEELESSHVSSVVRKSAGACGTLTEEARVEDPNSIIFDGISLRTLEENKLSYHLEDSFQIRNAESLTYSESLHLTGADETMPVLESFVLQSNDEQPRIADERINFDKLSLPKTSIERASILEQLCRSACLQTPVSCFSTLSVLHKISNLYQSVPTWLLEGMDKPKDDDDCFSEVFNCAFEGRSYLDCLPNSTSQSDWEIEKPCMSPVRKVWDRIISKSDSSEKRMSLIPELPCICEENENVDEVADTYQEGIVSEILTSSAKREPLAEIIANRTASEADPHIDRSSLDSVNTEFSFNETHKRAKQNVGNGKRTKRRFNNKANDSMSLGATAPKGKTGLLHNQFSRPKVSTRASSRRGGPSLTVTEPKPSDIISNITSFIPLVQQKQVAAAITGKRDVKVKALEAAEAIKRLAEKKDNERKAKKEAMKPERTRLEQENLRQLELQKKQKEVEPKKKEADMAAKKRQREEEERKDKQRKRMRAGETRKQQRENEKKLHEKDAKYRTMVDSGQETKESKDERRNHKKTEQKNEDVNLQRLSEAGHGHATTQASTSDGREPSIICEDTGVLSDIVKYLKVKNLDKPTGADNLVATENLEQSYDISSYKCSDDEDEEDDVPNTKFVPSWARYASCLTIEQIKSSVVLIVSSQDRVDPQIIFLPESFCSIAEVLLPRKK